MPRSSQTYRRLKINVSWIFLAIPILLSAPDLWADLAPSQGAEAAAVLARMEASYARIETYQTEMEVREYRKGKYLETRRFLYSFKKPNQLRIEMQSPSPGTVLVYPDKGGKVTLQTGGWARFIKLHLAPGNALLASGQGQRIDQSDFGLLIRNIGWSLGDRRRGEITLSDTDGRVSIEVLAQDHFLPDVQTLYRIVIDKARWLPLELHESTASGAPRRKMFFRNLRTSIEVSDEFLRIAGSR